MRDKQCCGTCRYYYHDQTMLKGDHICVNDQSEYVTDYVEQNHSCLDWEKAKGGQGKYEKRI